MNLKELQLNRIDPETGLPRLPEDYFFRLRRPIYKGGYSYVEIRMRHTTKFLFWTTTHTDKVVEQIVYPVVTEDTFKSAAEAAVKKFVAELNAPNDLYGDYPPKKLGA